MIKKILVTNNSRTTVIIRAMVGAVFLSEGIQKFLFPEDLGSGRFAKIGLSLPELLGPFVGSFEVICGALILLGLFTRLAAIPLLTIMLMAISTTKLNLIHEDGFWSMLHDSRTDWSMLLGSIFLIIEGSGKWSLDRLLWKKHKSEDA